MLATWGRFDSPNKQLLDWLFPTTWYRRFLYLTVVEKHFWSGRFCHQWRTRALSLSQKGCESHKPNPRFPAPWTLLCLPGMMPHLTFSLACCLRTIQLSPTVSTHPSTGPDFLDELASSLVKLVGTALFPLWWEAWLRPGVFLSKDSAFWFLHRKFPKLHFLPLFCFSDQFTGQDEALKPVLALSVLNLEKIQKESENSQTFRNDYQGRGRFDLFSLAWWQR